MRSLGTLNKVFGFAPGGSVFRGAIFICGEHTLNELI